MSEALSQVNIYLDLTIGYTLHNCINRQHLYLDPFLDAINTLHHKRDICGECVVSICYIHGVCHVDGRCR